MGMVGTVRLATLLLAASAAASCGDDSKSDGSRSGDPAAAKSASLGDNDTPLAKMASVITRPDVSGVPHGYQVMKPVSAEANAVLLVDEQQTTLVPIFIGTTEAHSIDMRLHRQTPPRPLTHDLFDATLRQLGAELVRVQVDDLREGVFIGSIFIRQGARIIELDARPSDAIALAVGNDIPVYVAEHVVRYAGTPLDDSLVR